MSPRDPLNQEDRTEGLDDQKRRIIDWIASEREAPAVGIYDEPVRYYKANLQWVKHIAGMVHHLTELYAWRDANDETYQAIQEILIYLEGVEVQAVSCEDVEDCLETSTIINNIVNNSYSSNAGDYNITTIDKNLTEFNTYNTYVTNNYITPQNGCDDSDKNKLWHWIKSMVFSLHRRNRDMLNYMVTNTSDAAGASESLFNQIPLYQAELDAISAGVPSFYIATIAAAYASFVTNQVLYETSCELFCERVDGDCTVGIDDLMAFFRSKLVNPPATITPNIGELLLFALQIANGEQAFYYLSWLQLTLIFANERFGDSTGAQALGAYAESLAAEGSNGWKAYCTDCAPPTDGWTIVLDFANDYVPETEDEIVITNAFELIHDSETNNRNGVLSQQYLEGYKVDGGDSARRRFATAELADFSSVQINWRTRSGSSVSADFFSGVGYNFPEFTTSSDTFLWSSVRNLNTTVPISINEFEWTVAPNASIRYLRIFGEGQAPKFI